MRYIYILSSSYIQPFTSYDSSSFFFYYRAPQNVRKRWTRIFRSNSSSSSSGSSSSIFLYHCYFIYWEKRSTEKMFFLLPRDSISTRECCGVILNKVPHMITFCRVIRSNIYIWILSPSFIYIYKYIDRVAVFAIVVVVVVVSSIKYTWILSNIYIYMDSLSLFYIKYLLIPF